MREQRQRKEQKEKVDKRKIRIRDRNKREENSKEYIPFSFPYTCVKEFNIIYRERKGISWCKKCDFFHKSIDNRKKKCYFSSWKEKVSSAF